MERYEPTARTTVKRLPKRGEYDRAAVHAILDEGFVCHIGFVHEGKPVVIPTGYARVDENVYVHGSAASRMLRSLADGIDVCITVTLVDGLVLARSAFHHSMNYRSVVVFGTAVAVEDENEKMMALRAFTDHIIPDRWDVVREPDPQEMKATLVLRLPLLEVSAKVRTGPPIDDEVDLSLDVWAGVLPLKMQTGTPVRDSYCPPDRPVPQNVLSYHRGAEKPQW